MKEPSKTKHICIHGHFYQPPRENPWLEEIEREDSASPYHDWNERIHMECYRANAAARLTADDNRILGLRNNYLDFSFNFGPTLMRWIERKHPWVYRAILDADRDSLEIRNGHGNAIAQVYNHVIMPLANQRDKVTQVLWGIRDFTYRFGRRPEGMWLAETAVDRSTLSVLADAGIKFTILSPYQAAKWRFLRGDGQWQDACGGVIPTGRAYRYDCGGGKVIHIFFYDPALARGVAFERVLEHSSKFLAQIDRTYGLRDESREEPWLVNTATDGESYGHHFKFGDMALAAAFQELEHDPSAVVTNYGNFLASFPVVAEVEIFENTAWSCAHGLGRWSEDCGCRIGSEPGWNQKWRAPLRRALNFLRDALAVHYETEMRELCNNPWQARDEYIDVILDQNACLEGFLKKHLIGGPASGKQARLLELLEMQRFALLMFTSCGWFFDEISQLESLLLLKYAARAMQLAQNTGAEPLEQAFLRILEEAPSNVPELGNGARVYLEKVKPEIVSENRVAANYAIQSLALSSRRQFRLYTYEIVPQKEEDLGANPVPSLYGHITVRDKRTLADRDFVYMVIHFGGLDFRCSVKPYTGDEEYFEILEALQGSVEEQNTMKMLRVLDEKFGTTFFGLEDVFRDLRSSLAIEISRAALGAHTELQRTLYNIHKPLISSLKQWGISIPSDLRVSIRRLMSDEIEQLVERILRHEEKDISPEAPWYTTDFFYRAHMARLNSLLDEAKTWVGPLLLETVSARLGQALVRSMTQMEKTFDQAEAGRLYRLLTVGSVLDVKPETWKLQTLYFHFVMKGVAEPELLGRIPRIEKFLSEIDQLLWCRFARLLGEVPVSFSRDLMPLETASAFPVKTHGSD